jgi:hypothetical protein
MGPEDIEVDSALIVLSACTSCRHNIYLFVEDKEATDIIIYQVNRQRSSTGKRYDSWRAKWPLVKGYNNLQPPALFKQMDIRHDGQVPADAFHSS